MKAIIRAVAGAILAGLVLTSGTSVTHGLSGGQASSEAPWSVRIIADGKEICSGSVIAARLVLTARHCVEGYRSWTVYLPSKAVVTKTKEYAPSSVGDAAILVLSQDSGVAPVRLASKTQATSFVNRGVTFFGWGWTGIRKDGSKTIGTGLPSKVQKSPNGAYFLAKYCQSKYLMGPVGLCFFKRTSYLKDKVATIGGDSGGSWVGWDNGWVLLAVHGKGWTVRGGQYQLGPDGGASVGADVTRNWIVSVKAKYAAPATKPVTPAPADYGASGSVFISPCLDFHQSPGHTSPVVGCIPKGTIVRVQCVAYSNFVNGLYGSTNIWDRVTWGGRVGFVTDAWVFTNSNGPVAGSC